MDTRTPTSQEIAELVAFLPLLNQPGFSPVKNWYGGEKDDDGIITMPWPEYKLIVIEFVRVASSDCWTDPEYLTKSAGQMLNNDDIVKTADLNQIKTMLTFCIRGERFVTGHWNAAFENGYVRRLLSRLAELGLDREKS